MNKRLVIVTTDMEIELAILVDGTKLTRAREAVSIARERYYAENYHSRSLDGVLTDVMKEYGIDFEIIEYEEM